MNYIFNGSGQGIFCENITSTGLAVWEFMRTRIFELYVNISSKLAKGGISKRYDMIIGALFAQICGEFDKRGILSNGRFCGSGIYVQIYVGHISYKINDRLYWPVF
ncbi:hypothetical protein SS50377_25339 [Spironucleus salmonicida]|uniref:Uncharacterized protein n=1 Tax=Spironucleus salmonicida TaxID=348837 RepID=A0A9P8LS38_9EUKA|nr:hypothetical protein SS50377_25339 [Spironucleus salmonicida]